jgi:hypothetical protein
MKRTEKLDREREVALPMYGKDVFTTVGDLTLTEEEKAELSDGLKAVPLYNLIDKMAQEIEDDSIEFIRTHLFHMAKRQHKDEVVHAIVRNDLPGIEPWLKDAGINFIRDGLTTVIRQAGRVVAQYTYEVDKRFRSLVLKQLKLRTGGHNIAS